MTLHCTAGILTVEIDNELHAVGGTLSAGPSGSDWLVRTELPPAQRRT